MNKNSLFPYDVVIAAHRAQDRFGCPIAISLAQWALESGFGKKVTGNYNYFGLKWNPNDNYPFKLCWTKEQKKGIPYPVRAKFISFPNMEVAFIEHAWRLMNPKGRYAAAIPKKDNWRAFLAVIAPIYATDARYSQKITKIVETYQLDRY